MKFILRIVFHLIALLSFVLCLGVVFLWSNASVGTQSITADNFKIGFEADQSGIGATDGHGSGLNPLQPWHYEVGASDYSAYRLRYFREPVHEDVVGFLGFSYLPEPKGYAFFARYISLVVLFGILPLLWILLTVRRFSRKKHKQEPEAGEAA